MAHALTALAFQFRYSSRVRLVGVAVGTIKSRVNRARIRLAEFLNITGDPEFGPDNIRRAVLA